VDEAIEVAAVLEAIGISVRSAAVPGLDELR
jgi:hypothetical protein